MNCLLDGALIGWGELVVAVGDLNGLDVSSGVLSVLG